MLLSYLNCELLQNKTALETTNSEVLKRFLGNYDLIVLDEAQYIQNIGLVLKVLVDSLPSLQIIATGSSSFDPGNRIAEPLTGRSRVFQIFPFSIMELRNQFDLLELQSMTEGFLRFGLYPEVIDKPESEAMEELSNIASNYLYKDILQFERLKRSDLILNLLKALALQIGNEISLNELSRLLGENVHTIKKYIELLEKAFIIYRLTSFSRNLRKEIGKGQKIYFYDIGIRNYLIRNFNPMNLRNDAGGLWENLCVIERIKNNQNRRKFVNTYFWRTYDQKEIDFIEEEGGKLRVYEFKYSKGSKTKVPVEFLSTYPESSIKVIDRETFWEFIE